MIVETIILSTIVGFMAYDIYRCLCYPVSHPVIPLRQVYSHDPYVVSVITYSLNLNEVAPLSIHSDNCPICLEDVEIVRTTVCGHRFCDGCLSNWIQKSQRCPMCNQDMLRLNNVQSM
jgi:hypothetical protein